MDKNSFLKCQSEILAFKELTVQLEQSAHSDYIAIEYLRNGFDKLNEMLKELQEENEQLNERIYVLEKENITLQIINDSLVSRIADKGGKSQ